MIVPSVGLTGLYVGQGSLGHRVIWRPDGVNRYRVLFPTQKIEFLGFILDFTLMFIAYTGEDSLSWLCLAGENVSHGS